jgi:hypothetical protein
MKNEERRGEPAGKLRFPGFHAVTGGVFFG